MTISTLRRVLPVAMAFAALFLSAGARADVAYSQPPNPAGGHYKSAWYPPDGLDGDEYAWDAFTIASGGAITEVHWRGCYTNYLSGAGTSPVYDFTVSIYASIAGGFQPDVTNPPLARFHTNSNAGEAPAGTFGGVAMYDYAFTLPSPFQAAAGVKYWLQVEASQGLTPTYYWPPDWSLAAGTGGDGSHFRKITGGNYASISGDCAFTLYTSAAPSYTINASASPSGTGTILGAGSYPSGSNATLTATPNAGYGFDRWTEGGSPVSTNPRYSFTVTRNRTLVANFVPAYTVATSAWPIYAGTTSGAGTFNSGTSVTILATPRPGFAFDSWLDYGNPVSTSASYTFPIGADHSFMAVFVPLPGTVTFDLDSGVPQPLPQSTSTPFSILFSNETAYFNSPQDGGPYQPAFSLQSDATTFQHQTHLTGAYLWPDSVFRNDLDVRFTPAVTSVSFDFATVEMEAWADTPSPVVVTAYQGSTSNPPVGSAQSAGFYGLGTTYPEGFVTLSSAVPFDVIHITVGPNAFGTNNFLSDNFTVSVPCVAPGIVLQPSPTHACPAGGSFFEVAESGSGPFTYQWQRDAGAGVFVDLADGPTGAWDGAVPGIGAIVSGSNSPVLFIAADTASGLSLGPTHAIAYRCMITNACAGVASDPATLTVGATCDFNQDGATDLSDVFDLADAIASGTNPNPGCKDFNQDGSEDTGDVLDLADAVASGTCP